MSDSSEVIRTIPDEAQVSSEDFPTQFADAVEAWGDTWVAPKTGPLFMVGVVKAMLPPEQVAGYRPEQESYNAAVDCATRAIVQAIHSGEPEEVIGDIDRTLTSKIGSRDDLRATVLLDILKSTAVQVADQAVETTLEPIFFAQQATEQSQVSVELPNDPEIVKQQLRNLSRTMLNVTTDVVNAQGRRMITQVAIMHQLAHNGVGVAQSYLSILLNEKRNHNWTNEQAVAIFKSIYELISVVAPESLEQLDEREQARIAAFADMVGTRNHTTQPGEVADLRSFNYVHNVEVEAAIDGCLNKRGERNITIMGAPGSGLTHMVNYSVESAKQNGYYPVVVDVAQAADEGDEEARLRAIVAQLDPMNNEGERLTYKDVRDAIIGLQAKHPRLLLLLDNLAIDDPVADRFVSIVNHMSSSKTRRGGNEEPVVVIKFYHDGDVANYYLANFDRDQVRRLAIATGKDVEQAEATFALTQGQPYLTQLLLHYDNELSNPVVQQGINQHIAKIAGYIAGHPYGPKELARLVERDTMNDREDPHPYQLINAGVVNPPNNEGTYTWSNAILKEQLPEAV